jgi:hypothetical protein
MEFFIEILASLIEILGTWIWDNWQFTAFEWSLQGR